LGDFKEDIIRITGIPHFDFYFRKELILPRKKFFQQIGGDPAKKLIVFAGCLKALKINYEYFFDYFNEITQNGLLENSQFYLRPHPKDFFNERLVEKYKNNPHLIFPKITKSSFAEGNYFELPEGDEQFLLNLLYYADILIAFQSTIILEAALMNTPIVIAAYFGRSNNSYYYKADRGFEKEHLQQIFKRNFCRIAKNNGELLGYLKTYLANPTLDKEDREGIVKEQLYLTNGKAAANLAKTITDIAKRRYELF